VRAPLFSDLDLSDVDLDACPICPEGEEEITYLGRGWVKCSNCLSTWEIL
jgi:hypothetical protein